MDVAQSICKTLLKIQVISYFPPYLVYCIFPFVFISHFCYNVFESEVVMLKLNQECIRDLLLYLEENLSYENNIKINDLSLKKYSKTDLIYSADKLNEIGYLNCMKSKGFTPPIIIVKSITYNGHQFLDNIRDNKVWSKTKSILKPFKSASIEIISETASKVFISLINQQLGNV